MIPLEAIQHAFEDFVSKNRDSKSGEHPRYRWEGLGWDAGTSTLRAKLIFAAGESYCCFEPGCHVPLLAGAEKAWGRLRRALAIQGAPDLPVPLRVQLVGVVEAGAVAHSYPGGIAGPSDGYEYDELFEETRSEP